MDRRQALAGLMGGVVACSGNRGVRVGSKNFTEQVILGEIIAQHLEKRLGRPVTRRLNLGGTLLAHQSLLSGQIDAYPEYSGTALAAILKQPFAADPEVVRQKVRAGYQPLGVEWLDPLGINNTFAMVVSGKLPFQTLSDAAKADKPWVLGVGYEFEQRDDGLKALDKTYSIRWQDRPKTMDLGLLYKALEQGQVTMIAANSTDGLLSKLDLKILTDNKHAFPPYEVSIAARREALQTAGVREALQQLSGKFTNQQMQQMNYQVDGEHKTAAEVAAAFLTKL
jgi:glycine betaine/choline ABC-type transport system substrate-binding protein